MTCQSADGYFGDLLTKSASPRFDFWISNWANREPGWFLYLAVPQKVAHRQPPDPQSILEYFKDHLIAAQHDLVDR
jgi:hypothetical protein